MIPLGRRCQRLLDVSPEGGVKTPGKDKEERQEEQDPDPNLLASLRNRLGDPDQERGQVGHEVVVVGYGERTGLLIDESDEFIGLLPLGSNFFEFRPIVALEFPEHVRHADRRVDRVVPARGAGWIQVIASHVGVDPITP